MTVPNNNTASAHPAQKRFANTSLNSITHATTGATGISNDGVSGSNGLPSGISATWSGNVITISGTPTVTGTFNYSVPLTGGCGSVNARTITVNTLPTVDAGSDQTVCFGDDVTLSGSGASTYSWDNGITDNTAFTASTTTTYTVTGTDANGCQNTDRVTVTVNALPTVSAGSDQPFVLVMM